MDGWKSKFSLFFSGSYWSLSLLFAASQQERNKCNVLWSPLFPILGCPLSFFLSLPLWAQIMGLCRKGNTPRVCPSFLPHSLPFDLFINSSSLLPLCFFPPFLPLLSGPAIKMAVRFWLGLHYWWPRCYIHYLMALTFGLVKVTVYKLSDCESH